MSLSPITRDARVLRQLSVLAEFGDVTTVGFGDKPADAAEHIEVPSHLSTLPQTPLGVLNLAFRRLRSSETQAPAVSWMIERLRVEMPFDLVVANDARVLAGAFAVSGGAPVWADMHEWAPEERTHVLRWRLLVAPLMDHLCRTYLPRAQAVSTVGGEIADLYAARYGVQAVVVRNSSRRVALSPTEVDESRVRLVHSGAAVQGRNIEGMIDVVRQLDARFTLDLYLVSPGADQSYLESLKKRARGDARIVFQSPVAPSELPAVLNQYDVGVFWIPPVHTNARLTLPNKLFDFVQARLAIAVGPSIEMERIVRGYDIGVVSTSFALDDCAASLESLDATRIRQFKANAGSASPELSFEADAERIRRIVREAITVGRSAHARKAGGAEK
ncbi:hypothetical protein JF531_04655 [Microbacterium esteraromaticum]|nr:hypothetical protein [Microbacterium esteraromaticum]